MGPLWELNRLSGLPDFTRGILEVWYTTSGKFILPAHQAAVREQFPLLGVDRLVLTDPTKRVNEVADSPALAWVVMLRWIDARIGDDAFAALAKSPHTERLSRILIGKPRCSDAGLKAFANSKSYPNLRSFGLYEGLWGGKFTAAGVRQVLESEHFPRLEELDLSGPQRSSVPQRTFFSCKALSRLRVLRLGFGTDMKALARCPHLTNLEEVHVKDSRLTDADARALADNPAFGRVKTIELSDLNSRRTAERSG